jgi:hypothetical protein
MRALLYRPSWQLLRVSFLKDNRNDGGWTTGEGTRKNLSELYAYTLATDNHRFNGLLLECSTMGWSEEYEYAARLYRAINCLNAVRMGYSGQGLRGAQIDDLVLAQRNEFQSKQTVSYHRQLTFAAARWDWRIVKKELEHILSVSRMSFDQIEENLLGRRNKSNITNRPELDKFLNLLDEVRTGV